MGVLKQVASTLMPERLKQPLRSSSFRSLALGKSISYLGDWLMVAVLVGWVYQSTSSVSQVALLMAIRLVPTIGGALVGVMAGSRTLVFTFVGLCGLVSMVSTVAGNALIPMTVEQDELPA